MSAFAIYNRKASSKHTASFFSEIENAILRSSEPIKINETQEISALGNRGIWANKCEVCTWKGDLPLCEYPINEDACPEILNKRSKQRLEYIQEMAVRYLKPPAPPAPGEIIIKQEPNKPVAPAPPLIIRQQPPRPCTPEPLVIREAPPQPPQCVGRKVITISGKRLPPAPRKVVIERLAPVPSKPQSVMIERWLPYAEQKRRVIYQKPPPDPVVCKPRNVIIQWEAPEVCVRKEIKHLGVVCANPCDYVKRYGPCLKQPCELPQFVKDIPPQCGIELAANKKQNPVHELCGDVCALTMVNLDCEGLGIYKNQVKQKCGSGGNCCSPPKSPSNKSSSNYSSSSYSAECSQGRCSSSNSSQSTNMSSSTMYASVSGYGTASGSASNEYATPSYDSCSPPCPAPCPPTSSSYESPTVRQQRSSNNTSRRHHHHHSHSHSHSHQHNHSQNSYNHSQNSYNHSNHTNSPTSGGSSKNSSRRSSPKYSVVNISQSPTYY